MTEEMIEHYTKLNAYYDEKVRQFKNYECRTCKDGEVYNDEWCRCQHPLIKGCRVKMSDGCEAKKLIKAQKEYEQMRKESHETDT